MIKRIICVSDAIGTIVKEVVKDDSKVVTVYDGVDANRLHAGKKLNKEDHPFLQNGKTIIGNIAALAGHKDHDTFIRSVDRYRERFGLNNIHFVIVGGDGGEEESIRQLIGELNLESAVTLTGYVKNPQDYLASFDIFLFTSKMEGLGTSVIDAMTIGLPIVSTLAGGLSELIDDRETGLAVPIGDPKAIAESLHELVLDESLQAQLSQGARLKAKSFEASNMVQGTLDVYQALFINVD